eukprot:4544581-Prymnesium_polylepis.1
MAGGVGSYGHAAEGAGGGLASTAVTAAEDCGWRTRAGGGPAASPEPSRRRCLAAPWRRGKS